MCSRRAREAGSPRFQFSRIRARRRSTARCGPAPRPPRGGFRWLYRGAGGGGRRGAGRPPPTAPDTWLDPAGKAVGESYQAEGAHWVRLWGIGDFRVRAGDPVVVAAAVKVERVPLLRESFDRVILPLALELGGQDVLHASGIVTARGAVALCGTKETGKSTIAYAFGQRGFRLWADDAVAFQLDGDHVLSPPLPFAMRLRPPSARFFGRSERLTGSTVAVPVEPAKEALALGAVCVLERNRTGSPATVERIRPTSALTLVLPHAYFLSGEVAARRPEMVENYLGLVARVPIYHARIPGGLERLDDTLDAIERGVLRPRGE